VLSLKLMPTICIPFWTGDRPRAERLLNWLKEIGGTHFPIMLLASKEADPDSLLPLAKESNPESFVVYDYENIKTDWAASKEPGRSAQGPNSLFRQAATYFHDWTGKGNGKGEWFFLETDAFPICTGWDVKLFEEYKQCGKPFMGAHVPGGDGYPEHMSGVAVWPQNTPELAGDAMRCERGAFDVVGASQIVPNAAFTTSIVHKFWHPGFKSQDEVDEWIKPNTLVFHANKDGSLLPFLRERTTGRVVQLVDTADLKSASPAGSTPAAPTSLNVVKTYYEKLEGRNHAEQEWLLGTWADSWRKHGWHPVVINHDLAKTHPYYQMFLKAYTDLPSVNGKDYELACYIRHVAMVQSGGGLLVDYDVINVGFTPDMLPHTNQKYPAIMADKNPCPCGVYGSAEEYDKLCYFMAKQGKEAIVQEGGRPHTSDQHFIQHFAAHFYSYEIIWQYGQKGWEKAKLIHFSSGSCQGRPRSEVIPSALDFVRQGVKQKIINDVISGIETANVKPLNGHTWIGEVRELADRLKSMADTPMRQQQISTELKKRFTFRTRKR
jgi:hypothetical protein